MRSSLLRMLALLLVLCLLLSACSSPEPGGAAPTETPTAEPSQPTSAPPASEPDPPALPSLMDSRVELEGSENLYYIPNVHTEDMTGPELLMVDQSLLMMSTEIVDESCKTCATLVSAEDGRLLGSTSFDSEGFTTMQASETGFGFCDSGSGTVKLFDRELRQTRDYSLERSSNNWYLSRDLQTLYQVDWQSGVCAVQLATGEERQLLTNVTDVYVQNASVDAVVLSYIDLETQRMESRLLDLQDGSLEPLPVTTDVSYAANGNGVWLLGDIVRWGTYHLIADGQKRTIYQEENRLELLLPQGHLFSRSENGSVLTVYDTQGAFISRCELPAGTYMGQNIVWSDLWGGYFFVAFGEDQPCRLLFWDTSRREPGEDLVFQTEQSPEIEAGIEDLYARAEALSEQFGVEIRIGNQCQLEYSSFSGSAISDRDTVTHALDVLESALSVYPDGFLRQLKYGRIQRLQFELVGCLSSTDPSNYNGSYSGFAYEDADRYLVVLDVYTIWDRHIFHELTHVLDQRLAWDALLRPEAMFSEDGWMALQPPGFTYAGTYLDLVDSEIWNYVDSGYFVDDYACRFPTEDRARMMEAAIDDGADLFQAQPPLREKLIYYSACIRDCFDTTGWPEVTVWESAIGG